MFDNYKLRNYDFRLLFYVLALNTIGILIISSATNGNMSYVSKQLLGMMLGIGAMVILSVIPYRRVMEKAIPIYGFCLILLAAVLVVGHSAKGASRWLKLPGMNLQPSELAKIGMIIFLAWLLDKYQDNIDDFLFLVMFAVLAGSGLLLVVLEPDLSTTIVFVVMVLSMLFVAGISYKWVIGAIAVVVPLGAAFIFLISKNVVPFLRGYQANRILAWINPGKYADASQQQKNSIMAIGSGLLAGKGLNNNTLTSVKNGNFIAEDQTDFIFAVIGEELGFIGCVVVIGLFALIVFECFHLAGKARDLQGKLVCVGYGMMLGFQSFANISVATGIFPNTGLTLPFISYGLSSLICMYLGIGIVLNIGLSRRQ